MKELYYQNIYLEIIKFDKDLVIHLYKGNDLELLKKESLFFPYKRRQKRKDFTFETLFDSVSINFSSFSLKIKNNDLKTLQIYKKDKLVFNFDNVDNFLNSGELPDETNCPYIFPLFDNPKVVLSKKGYKVNKDGFQYFENNEEMFLLICKKDINILRKLYVNLTGRVNLIPFSAFGVWDSKFYEYNDELIEEELNNFKKYQLAIDNFVIDTDWRKPSKKKGAGYKINTIDFPLIEKTFNNLHKQNISVMFNDHPEPLKDASNAFSNIEIKYRRNNLIKILDKGLDYWWYDRNWWTRLKSLGQHLSVETCGLYLYSDIASQVNKNRAKNELGYTPRTLIMGNIDDIANGRYLGISNSASHRYPIQWSGDTWMTSIALEEEFKNMIKSNNNLITYYSSDLTGHMGDGDIDLYCRFIEYGAFSPIFRLHSTKGQKRYRQPWFYGDRAVEIYKKYVSLRYRLLPIFYSFSYVNYLNGTPLIRPAIYKKQVSDNSCFLGDSLLFGVVLPIGNNQTLPQENYLSKVEACYYDNPFLKGEIKHKDVYDKIDFSWEDNNPWPTKANNKWWSATFKTKIKIPSFKSELIVGSDDGVRVYVNDKLVGENWGEHAFTLESCGKYDKNEIIDLKIEFYQAEGNAYLKLFVKEVNENDLDTQLTYLPKGEFVNLFTGEILKGENKIIKEYEMDKIPLYVPLSRIIVLNDDALNTSKINWDRLSIHIFPGEDEYKFYLYEDDRVSTNYQNGEYKITNFSFKKKDNGYEIEIEEVEGQNYKENIVYPLSKRELKIKNKIGEQPIRNYRYNYNLLQRHFTFKFYELKDEIKEIYVDDKLTEFKRINKNKNSFILPFEGDTPTSNSVEINTSLNTKKRHKILFVIK